MSAFGKLISLAAVLALPILPAIAEDKTTAPPADASGVADPRDAKIASLRAELNRINLQRVEASLVQPAPEKKKDVELAELTLEVEQARAALNAKKALNADAKPGVKDKDKDKDKSAKGNDQGKVAKDDDAGGDAAPREQIDKEIAKARARMRQDARQYSRSQLQEAESLYQVANKQWRSPEAKANLEKLIEKYPKFNRTGCGLLYLGQYAEGEQRETYLKQAIADFSDCYYGNGVQVGAYARYLLGLYYRDKGDVEKGNALLKEVVEKYPTSITHKGDKLAKIAKNDMATPPPPK